MEPDLEHKNAQEKPGQKRQEQDQEEVASSWSQARVFKRRPCVAVLPLGMQRDAGKKRIGAYRSPKKVFLLDNPQLAYYDVPEQKLSISQYKGEKMKRTLGLLVVLAAVLLIAGCSLEKTYYYAVSVGSGYGFCEEVTTNDSNVQDSLTTEGFTAGTCASQGYSGTYCEFTGTSTGGKTYTIDEYFEGTYYTSSVIAQACTTAGGTVKQ
ncbi:MAG: hypothetical protein ABSF77_01605 [Spirochaetia bacterium]